MIPVRWTEQAADDLVAIHAFFARDSPAYARTIAEHLYQAVGQLRTFPDSGRAIRERHDPALRELVVRGYRIAYRRRTDVIEILTIFHSALPTPTDLR